MRNMVLGSFVGFLLAALVLAACGGSSSITTQTGTVEQRVLQLESQVAELQNHLSVDAAGKLTLSAPDICILATGTVDIKGSLVRFNDGTRPTSGAGDSTGGVSAAAGGMETGNVTSGSPTVLIP